MAESFNCSLVTPEEKVLEEPVTYASIPAWDGQIGIAPGRAPLLVKLGVGVLRLHFPGGGDHKYLVQGGFAQMIGEDLTVLSTKAAPAEQFASADADSEYQQALAMPAVSDDEFQQRQDALQSARTKRVLARHVSSHGV